jgi:hypothetical protein
MIIALGIGALAVTATIFVLNERLFDPVLDLVQTTILDKPYSESGVERAYWNAKSLQAFVDTNGLGIGMGSSRSSSWMISVLAQLGIVGTFAILALVLIVLRSMSGLVPTAETAEIFAFASSVRAAIVANVIAGALAGSGADPGTLFFVALSVTLACRQLVENNRAISRFDIRRSV